jgi:hypothetical protein
VHRFFGYSQRNIDAVIKKVPSATLIIWNGKRDVNRKMENYGRGDLGHRPFHSSMFTALEFDVVKKHNAKVAYTNDQMLELMNRQDDPMYFSADGDLDRDRSPDRQPSQPPRAHFAPSWVSMMT